MEKIAICIASGPSLTQEDIDYVRGKGRVYAVKEMGLKAPWADAIYAADTDWWVKYPERWQNFEGRKATCSPRAAELYDLEYYEAKTNWHWSNTPGKIATCGNSGYQTINLAGLDGADKIILLGYDMGFSEGDDKHSWDKEMPRHSRPSNYNQWLKRMAQAAPFIPVPILNATKKTAINFWPQVDLREVL